MYKVMQWCGILHIWFILKNAAMVTGTPETKCDTCTLFGITAKCHLDPTAPISAKSNNATFIEKECLDSEAS
ncbi:hypothetical protein A6R68_07447, partial [Neotoma lepida]